MRIAIKYSMDDVRDAIVEAIIKAIRFGIGGSEAKRIEQLAFMGDFPDHVPGYVAVYLFLEVCSIEYHPTADELRPLMAHPALVALVMQCREGLSDQSLAIWNNRESSWSMETWLKEQLESLGFKP